MLAQATLIPWMATGTATTYPEVAYLAGPMRVLAILTLACVRAIVVAPWRLLTLAEHDRAFTASAPRWLDVIVAGATIALVTLALHSVLRDAVRLTSEPRATTKRLAARHPSGRPAG